MLSSKSNSPDFPSQSVAEPKSCVRRQADVSAVGSNLHGLSSAEQQWLRDLETLDRLERQRADANAPEQCFFYAMGALIAERVGVPS